MKLSYNQIESFARNFNAGQRAVLIYGPDHGLIQERAAEILKRVLPNPDDPFALTDLSGEQIAEDHALLFDEISSMNFFGGRKVIRIREHAEKASGAIAELFKNPPVGKVEELGFLLVLADDLAPKSPLRTLFENSDSPALPCYHDDGASLAAIIREEFRQRQLVASPDIVNYLTTSLKGDRILARQEIEKLDLYAGEDRELTLSRVSKCIGDLAESTLDEVIDSAALGNLEEADKKLHKAFGQGIVPIVLLRSLSRHFQRIMQVAANVEKGAPADQAIQQMRPPLFFKQQPVFKRQLGIWGNTKKVSKVISLLYQAELRIKKDNFNPETATARVVSNIAWQAVK